MPQIDEWVRRAMAIYVKTGDDDVSLLTSYRAALEGDREYVVLTNANGWGIALYRIEKAKPPRLKRIIRRWPSELKGNKQDNKEYIR